MLKTNFQTLKKITCATAGSLFLLCLTPYLSFASNPQTPNASERICLFRKGEAQKCVKKAMNLEGYIMVNRVEAKDGALRIVAADPDLAK